MSVAYKPAVRKMCDAYERRLIVNLDDLRDYDREFCDGCVLRSPDPSSLSATLADAHAKQTLEGTGSMAARGGRCSEGHGD